jgi:AAA domain, putative AbiEii toxin, Type IV TA system
MLFLVRPWGGSWPSSHRFPQVLLDQDNWDDYGYKASFKSTLKLARQQLVELGTVKVLKAGESGGWTKLPGERFELLPSGYYSLGQSLKYYEDLFRLGRAVYEPYLQGLADVAFNDELRASYEDEEAFQVSLLRFSGAERMLADAAKLFARRTSQRPKPGQGFSMKFRTKLARQAKGMTVGFNFTRRGDLPNRVNAVIGYNGTGKTNLLSNLAITASRYGYSRKRDMIDATAGRFVGTPPPFRSVIVVSYSAFDTFVIPGRTEMERQRLQAEGDIFGYVYCGLRERIEDSSEEDQENPEVEDAYRLRTPDEIDAEFLSAFDRIRAENRAEALATILAPLLEDASFQRIGFTPLYLDRGRRHVAQFFRGLSSGHKVALKIVTEVTAHIDAQHPSLVLIDEPETHLHPPLLAAMLKSIRLCLDQFDGYAIIATHSPVVLQETPARYVHVLRRLSTHSAVESPGIETFGENVGVITQEVFNLDDGSTDWHDTLENLARRHDIEEIEEFFGRRLGFAARSYVASVRDEQ